MSRRTKEGGAEGAQQAWRWGAVMVSSSQADGLGSPDSEAVPTSLTPGWPPGPACLPHLCTCPSGSPLCGVLWTQAGALLAASRRNTSSRTTAWEKEKERVGVRSECLQRREAQSLPRGP